MIKLFGAFLVAVLLTWVVGIGLIAAVGETYGLIGEFIFGLVAGYTAAYRALSY